MSGPSLYKTKLCILYEKNGHCSKPNCTFAHGAAELRLPGESSSFRGRRHNLDGDLRDKLGRHFSPERRPSLDRSGRRVQRFSGHENPRAFEKRRDVDYRENRRYDERSDYAGGLKAGSRIEVRERDERNKFLGYNNVLEEQLKDVEQDVKMLTDEKLRLEAAVERKERDADSLTSKIQELRTQLYREKEECKRITSSTKKFVKEYNRFLRAQDDVKRSEARLQKLGTQLSTYLLGNEGNDDRETDIEIVSDEEKNGRNLRSGSDLQNELQNTSSVSRKRHYVEQYTTKESVQDDVDQSLFTVYGENDSQAQDLYSEIYGPPVYDVYDDEGWIQVENKDLDDHELNNLFSEVLLQTVVFFLVDGSCLGLHNSISEEDYCANWAFGDSSPISTHRFNKENTALIGRREEDKVENGRSPSRWNRIPSKSFSEEESRARNEEDTMNKSLSKEDTRKRRRLSSGTSSSNKVMSSTSMAARVSDKVAEFDEENTREANGSPLISLPPPPPFRNAHFHGDEETKVDVIERRKADDVDSV